MERLFGRGAPSAEYTHNPFPDLDRLRNEAPRYYAPDRDAWFFSNPNDIVSLLRDDRLSMGDRISFLDHSAMFRTNVVRPLRTWFLSSEPLLLKIVQEVVKDCLEKLATQKDADLVDAVARAIPSNVMAELLNIPRADLSPLLHLAEDVIRSDDINWSLETEQTNKIGFLTLYFQRHWRFASDAP